MTLKETTVYVPTDDETNFMVKDISHGDYVTDVFLKKNQFLFDKEELIELLGSVWDRSFKNGKMSGMGITYYAPTKEQFINSLFNTEEDGK